MQALSIALCWSGSTASRSYLSLNMCARLQRIRIISYQHLESSFSPDMCCVIADVADLVLQNRKNHCIAVIGDGAITGGMAYEAMNHAGFLDKNMIVVLNDNQQVRNVLSFQIAEPTFAQLLLLS